ncbi:hypothetical protein Ancab_021376 [Ancistrocladus abbreviatus]
MFLFSCPLARLIKPFFKSIDTVDDVTQIFVMECNPISMFLWINGRPGVMIIKIKDHVQWQYSCDVGFCARVNLREFIAALESADDEDGIILEGDVLVGYDSNHLRMALTIERRGHRYLLRGLSSIICSVTLESSTFTASFKRLVAEANESGRDRHVIRIQSGGILDERNRALTSRCCIYLQGGPPELCYVSIDHRVLQSLLDLPRRCSNVVLYGLRSLPKPVTEILFDGDQAEIKDQTLEDNKKEKGEAFVLDINEQTRMYREVVSKIQTSCNKNSDGTSSTASG